MTDSKRTPGPWEIVEDDGEYAIKSGDTYVCAGGCGCCNSVDQSIANKADAILLAAAPELLERLHALEVAANSAAYCYNNRPEGFAAALQNLNDAAAAARELQKRIKGD